MPLMFIKVPLYASDSEACLNLEHIVSYRGDAKYTDKVSVNLVGDIRYNVDMTFEEFHTLIVRVLDSSL